MSRKNILWLMSDQHNASCCGYRGHPLVKTPNLDSIAARGVDFENGFANSPHCAPSRISFITGQYNHTHGMYGSYHSNWTEPNSATLPCQLRRYGYQTAMVGKAHMARCFDDEGFEFTRYTDLGDAMPQDPRTSHYFNYLCENGLDDFYEEGKPRKGMEYTMDGSKPAKLPYEHSIEHYTGNQALEFLKNRDKERPFFMQMSFQRPHAPIAPAAEYFDMYNPDDVILPDNACDFYENRFKSKPDIIKKKVENGCAYPMADFNKNRLKRVLASYYALITCIDMEIGRVKDYLEESGELENTIIFYTADHGDFAGEHGLFHKNLGIYDSIQRIPFLWSWAGAPQGVKRQQLVESVDVYPTICELCGVPLPSGIEGRSLVPIVMDKNAPGKDEVFCEYDHAGNLGFVSAIRTERFRLVYYASHKTGELYDHKNDSGETENLYNDPGYLSEKSDLLQRLLGFTMNHMKKTEKVFDEEYNKLNEMLPTQLMHKGRRYWSSLQEAYFRDETRPPV